MSFLNPLFLFGLLTVAIPLLIYLLNLRKPKRILFSTLAFFDALKTSALKRIRIKRWLLLALRCLAVLALVIAVSRPFLPAGLNWSSEREPKVIGLLIDNSPSMARVDRDGPYMSQALQLADQLIDMAEQGDRVLISRTNGSALSIPFLVPGAAKSRLSEIGVSNTGNYLSERLREMRDRLEEAGEPNKIIYVITDAQETQFLQVREPGDDRLSDVNVQLIKVGRADFTNTGFGDVELLQGEPGEEGRYRVRAVVENFGVRTAENQFLNLIADGEHILQQPFELDPGASEEFQFGLPGPGQASMSFELEIEGDELTFDNTYYGALQFPGTRKFLVLEENRSGRTFESYLKPMLEVIAGERERYEFDFIALEDLQAGSIPEYDAVILDGVRNIPDYISQVLADHVRTSSAGVLLLPDADGDINSYNRFLQEAGAGGYADVTGSYGSFRPVERMASPEQGHPVLETIFEKQEEEEIRLNTPEIFYYYVIEPSGSSMDFALLQTPAGRPLIMETKTENGRIIYSAIGSDPGWSNFPVKPFFAPFFFRVAEYLVQGEGVTLNNHTLGNPFQTVLQQQSGSQTAPELEKGEEIIIPEIRQTFRGTEIVYSATEWTPGWAQLKAGEEAMLFSVNQDAMESRFRALDEEEGVELLQGYFEHVQFLNAGGNSPQMLAELETASFGREIWYWFIILAIILLLLETVVSRHYKAETIQ